MRRVFTQHEIDCCSKSKVDSQRFAARFAAKEAFFKAIGTGMRDGMGFNEIEVVNNELGKPELNITGTTKKYLDACNINKVHVSLSHIEQYACAYVVLETNLQSDEHRTERL